LEIIKSLEKSKIVKDYEVLTFEVFDGGFYIKIKAMLINETELYIREYSDITERYYSYHWQDSNKRLLMRWDNSKHHKYIETYPHHLHKDDNVLPSYSISCEEILKIIENKILT